MSKKKNYIATYSPPPIQGATQASTQLVNKKNGFGSFQGGTAFGNFTGFGNNVTSRPDTILTDLRGYLITINRALLNEAYAELGIVQKIVDLPVNDAYRGGIKLFSGQLSPEQILQLETQIERNGDLTIDQEGAKWDRLFGGSGVIIMTDQDPKTPLDISAIGPKTPLEFRAADRWELTMNLNAAQGSDFSHPKFQYFNYYGIQYHKSRVLLSTGIKAPSWLRPRLLGFGLSVMEAIIRAINQYLNNQNLIFELLREGKIDYYSLKNLMSNLESPGDLQGVMGRIDWTNSVKSIYNAVVMDADDKHEVKQLSFGGIGEVMREIRSQMSCESGIPQSKLFGTPASGMADDTVSLENYYGLCETVRTDRKYNVLQILEFRCQKLFGFIPTDLHYEWAPLRVLSGVEEETVKDSRFKRVSEARQLNEITSEQFQQACNKDRLLPITLGGNPSAELLGDGSAVAEAQDSSVTIEEEIGEGNPDPEDTSIPSGSGSDGDLIPDAGTEIPDNRKE